VAKAVKDLIDFGQIQRGYSGIEAEEIDEMSEKINKTTDGALIKMAYDESPASKAGLMKGDVVVKIQDKAITGKSGFDEHMSYYRPGDKIKISYIHNGVQKETTMVLTNQDGETSLETNKYISSDKLGADFAPVSKVEQQKYKISNGVKVKNIRGGLLNSMNIEDGFIFLKFNGKVCEDPNALISALENANGRMQIEGMGTDGTKRIYNFW
jgi:serine protease Do